ncbi:bifunctional diguanylate cyclase/phosphodiesterase [Novosphingobium sp. Chol11]|uniref:putative bifunctional diguanylate cyclase/phosphodiesterase n=1 Tax=Novosphingobium sp. Chol11 TaxID=1385763 RepID=UPI0025D0A5C1|nr:GGDEF domain-containing protein [Novosphingobium sp. Chol11]
MTARSDPAIFDVAPENALEARIAQLERQLARERQTRIEAEAIAERGLREAYLGHVRIKLLSTIADAANSSTDPMEALRFTIAEVCAALGYAFANVLLCEGSASDRRLEACGIWFARDPDEMFSFAEKSRRLIAWPCASAPGRLLITKQSVWTRDVQQVAGFGRGEAAKQVHLRSSVSVPVLQGQDVIAAMEFFSHDQVEAEPELLDVLTQIGAQVGRVFKRRANERQLIANGFHDTLTGLPNRAMLEKQMNERFERNRGAGKLGLTLVYIDLDGFKLVNDAMGHHAGDLLLAEMARRMRETVKAFATIVCADEPERLLLARMGGDEFTVLIDAEDSETLAQEIAAAIHACLRAPHRIEFSDVNSAASIGIAHDDGSYDSVADLLQDADVAMYGAKARGDESTVVFDSAMRALAVKRLDIEAGLRQALETGGLCLWYQPIIDIPAQRIAGFEALLRWSRDGKIVMPNDFLPIAEERGLMNSIGAWVMREACKTAAGWRNILGSERPFYVGINVAPSQLLQPSFLDQVRGILLATSVDPRTIVMELTENAAVLNPAKTAQIFGELRAMGIRLSLDDFGTGHSSFSHLQTLQFDTLKIDRSFISGDNLAASSSSIVDAIMHLAQAMRIDVVAEGIESQPQLDRLAEIGCDFGQGYLFDRAMPSDQALHLLHQ